MMETQPRDMEKGGWEDVGGVFDARTLFRP